MADSKTNDEAMEHLEHLLNNLNLGTAKAGLGKIFVGLMSRIEELESGGGTGGEITSDNISDASTIGKSLIKSESQAAARSAIGAGTSNLTVGTGATDAKPGNYQPTWAQVTGKPAVIAAGTDAAAARTVIGAASAADIPTVPAAPTWTTLSGKPAVIASGADQAAARSSIGAGTGNSNLAIATTPPAALASSASVGTGATAARADHVHALPTAAQVGASPTSHNHAVTADAASGLEAAANIQALAVALSARIKTLEDAPVGG